MSYTYPDLNFTQFPENLDTFKQWLDVTATDGPLVRQYMEAINQGNTALANQILAQIPSASQKIVKAIDLNKLSQAIQAIERFYKTDIQSYVDIKQAEWEAIINQFDYKGQWSSGTRYLRANLISYITFGQEHLYLAVIDVPVGSLPTDSRYWREITIQGQQGNSGAGLSYRLEWEVGTKYNVNDAVTYDGALWMALIPSQGVIPTKGSESWRIIMNLATTTYPIQSNQPTNQSAGDLWFNTSENPTKFYYLEPLSNPATSEDIKLGKEAYSDDGQRIIGSKESFDIEWNSDISPLVWM